MYDLSHLTAQPVVEQEDVDYFGKVASQNTDQCIAVTEQALGITKIVGGVLVGALVGLTQMKQRGQ